MERRHWDRSEMEMVSRPVPPLLHGPHRWDMRPDGTSRPGAQLFLASVNAEAGNWHYVYSYATMASVATRDLPGWEVEHSHAEHQAAQADPHLDDAGILHWGCHQ